MWRRVKVSSAWLSAEQPAVVITCHRDWRGIRNGCINPRFVDFVSISGDLNSINYFFFFLCPPDGSANRWLGLARFCVQQYKERWNWLLPRHRWHVSAYWIASFVALLSIEILQFNSFCPWVRVLFPAIRRSQTCQARSAELRKQVSTMPKVRLFDFYWASSIIL